MLRRLNFVLAAAMLMAAALTLVGCGRNGPPLPPPGPVAAAPPAAVAETQPGGPAPAPGAPPGTTAQRNGFDVSGNPVAAPGQKKSFLLDPLLQ